MWMIWVGAHRGIFFAILTLAGWGAAIYWFFRIDWRRMKRNNRPHNWTVDMETKTGTGGVIKPNH